MLVEFRDGSKFLSTPSARRATHLDAAYEPLNQFLSTPSARRATFLRPAVEDHIDISIHALRKEGDLDRGLCIRGTCAFLSTPSARRATYVLGTVVPCWLISIHALRKEGD